MRLIITCFELISTIAFSASGAMVGIKKQMDYFGICMLGIITAVGGGVMRDLILGLTPPAAFLHPEYTIVAFLVSMLAIVPAIRRNMSRSLTEKILFASDSVGLGIFTVSGYHTAIQTQYNSRWFLVLFVAVITGVGGGVLRDVLAGERPYIFVKHIYACASIAGGMLCIIIHVLFGSDYIAMVLGCLVIVLIRYFSMRYKLNLPHA